VVSERWRCQCGEPVFADDAFCEHCGAPLGEPLRDHVETEAGECAAVSDRGLLHARNEDAVHVAATDGQLVAVVCDGVSTCAAPDVASAVAASCCADALAAGATIGDAVAAAGKAVQTIPWSGGRPDGPSTTIVAACADAAGLHVAWVGDSRAYWISDDAATRLTTDHSLAEEHRAAALAVEPSNEHMITRWLGPGAPDVPAATVDLAPSGAGRLVLCSDGLWNLVADEELGPLAASGPPLAAARALVETALARGGTDNVSVAVLDVARTGIAGRGTS
jgi:serine/threonine protein phosphatase PrpC